MKVLLITLITAVSAFAYAKNGGNAPMTPDRFMHESIEHSTVMAKASGAGVIVSSNAQFIDSETINVSLTGDGGSVYTYQCVLVDDFSKGGTVVKKDVRCASL